MTWVNSFNFVDRQTFIVNTTYIEFGVYIANIEGTKITRNKIVTILKYKFQLLQLDKITNFNQFQVNK